MIPPCAHCEGCRILTHSIEALVGCAVVPPHVTSGCFRPRSSWCGTRSRRATSTTWPTPSPPTPKCPWCDSQPASLSQEQAAPPLKSPLSPLLADVCSPTPDMRRALMALRPQRRRRCGFMPFVSQFGRPLICFACTPPVRRFSHHLGTLGLASRSSPEALLQTEQGLM